MRVRDTGERHNLPMVSRRCSAYVRSLLSRPEVLQTQREAFAKTGRQVCVILLLECCLRSLEVDLNRFQHSMAYRYALLRDTQWPSDLESLETGKSLHGAGHGPLGLQHERVPPSEHEQSVAGHRSGMEPGFE